MQNIEEDAKLLVIQNFIDLLVVFDENGKTQKRAGSLKN